MTLISSDAETFTVSKKVADMSNTIRDIVDGKFSHLPLSLA